MGREKIGGGLEELLLYYVSLQRHRGGQRRVMTDGYRRRRRGKSRQTFAFVFGDGERLRLSKQLSSLLLHPFFRPVSITSPPLLLLLSLSLSLS